MEKEGDFWIVLDSSKDAVIITDLKLPMKISFWNKKAEELLGYKRIDVLGRKNPAIPEEYQPELGLIMKEILKGNEVSYKSKRLTKEGKMIDVLVKAHPFKREDIISGIITEIRPLAEIKSAKNIITHIRKKQQIKKRSFIQIRKRILSELLEGERTINELSIRTNTNWRTVESHLVYLVGRGLIKEVFSSEYVRIFRITELGKLHSSGNDNLRINSQNRLNKQIVGI